MPDHAEPDSEPEPPHSERPIPGLNFESVIDRRIREAQERGAFDNLPGLGKPIKGLDGPRDELWWVKQLMEREQVSFTPPALALAKRLEEVDALVADERSESAVRSVVDDLNREVDAMLLRPQPVQSLTLRRLDADAVVARWRAGGG